MATVTDDLDRHASGDAAALVLRIVDVQKSFRRGLWPQRRRVGVLRGASLEVRSGEFVGLVGENGSGKSTLMQIIVGLLGRDGGLVEQPACLGYCPQLPMLWDKLTVDEHFELFVRAPMVSTMRHASTRSRRCSTSCNSRATAAIGSRRCPAGRGRS